MLPAIPRVLSMIVQSACTFTVEAPSPQRETHTVTGERSGPVGR